MLSLEKLVVAWWTYYSLNLKFTNQPSNIKKLRHEKVQSISIQNNPKSNYTVLYTLYPNTDAGFGKNWRLDKIDFNPFRMKIHSVLKQLIPMVSMLHRQTAVPLEGVVRKLKPLESYYFITLWFFHNKWIE